MDEPVLTGWKEVAAFLRVSERTAQRFEQELELPVGRVRGAKGSVVRANPAELRAWLQRTQQAVREARGSQDAPADRDDPTDGEPVPASGRLFPRLFLTVAGVIVALALVAVLAVTLIQRRHARAPTSVPPPATVQSIQLEVSGIAAKPLQLLVADGGEGLISLSSGETLRLSPHLAGHDLVLEVSQRAKGGDAEQYRSLATARVGRGGTAPMTLEFAGHTLAIAWTSTFPARR
jgi:hypothetical protein